MVDQQRTDIGYVSGRLCALVEYLHEACKNEYGRVSNVALVCQHPFAMMQQFVAVVHCYKKNPEFEPLLLELVGKLSTDGDVLPKHLNIKEQGDFMIAYTMQKGELKTYRLQLGNKIAALRGLKGMSQRELAEKANITQANINNIENGRYSVGIDILFRISSALDCDMQELVNTK
ncbi:helix-turn-helix domain-containing protein [Parabacteroides provencensis]|uniref:helix-turn-helix domain-containing protein n=1 Tax=Parabacteroides provencensis TaxID=1944636 RepID=UPI000C150119|nr:helix-turn-helix transcriptional regulator [Parabacteroides provencensis]